MYAQCLSILHQGIVLSHQNGVYDALHYCSCGSIKKCVRCSIVHVNSLTGEHSTIYNTHVAVNSECTSNWGTLELDSITCHETRLSGAFKNTIPSDMVWRAYNIKQDEKAFRNRSYINFVLSRMLVIPYRDMLYHGYSIKTNQAWSFRSSPQYTIMFLQIWHKGPGRMSNHVPS